MSQKKEVTTSKQITQTPSNNPYTDWQESFDKIENKDQMTIIELGCGEGTKYLTDNFKKVISIEFSRYPYDFIVTSPNHTFVKLESLKDTTEKDDVLIETRGETRPDFTQEVNLLMNEIKKYKADMIFVDFGFHFRGEVVQKLIDWGNIKIIAYHDTNEPYYGYSEVQPNLNKAYQGYLDPKGQGTNILLEDGKCSFVPKTIPSLTSNGHRFGYKLDHNIMIYYNEDLAETPLEPLPR